MNISIPNKVNNIGITRVNSGESEGYGENNSWKEFFHTETLNPIK